MLEVLGAPEVSVCGNAGQPMTLPEPVRDALYNVVLALSQGKGISLVPRHLKLTTQEAADLLNISRPTSFGSWRMVESHLRSRAATAE